MVSIPKGCTLLQRRGVQACSSACRDQALSPLRLARYRPLIGIDPLSEPLTRKDSRPRQFGKMPSVLLCRCAKQPACRQPCGRLLELWDSHQVTQLSQHPRIDRVIALGAHEETL